MTISNLPKGENMRKKLQGAIVLCLMLLASGSFAQDAQILQNSDFEAWTDGPGFAPDYWSNENPDSILATQETVTIHGGLYSTNLTWISQNQNITEFLSDPVGVVEGTTYTCTTWVYDTDPAGQVRISFRWNTGNVYATVYSQDVGWQQLVYSAVAPGGANTVRVLLRAYDISGSWDGNATVYVDDFVLWGQPVSGNIPPSITNVLRYPFPTVYPDDNVIVEATIIDSDGSITTDSMYTRVVPNSFFPVSHDSIDVNTYWFTIGMHNAGDSVEYYVVAIDNEGSRSQTITRGYTVIQEATDFTPIYYIQHTVNEGSLPDCFPSDSTNRAQTVTGIVVGRYERSGGSPPYQSRFLMQDATSPWSGLNVYFASDIVQVGDSVTVSGTIIEYFSETELQAISSFTNHSSGHALYAPQVLTCATYNSQDSCSVAMEPYEGMIIQFNNLTLTSSAGFGDFWANDGGADSVIVLNDLSTGGADSCIFTIGQTYSYVKGIGRYTFGQFKIAPRFSSDLYIAPTECTGGNIFDVQFTFDPGTDTADCWPSPDTGTIVNICGIVTAVTQGTQPRFYLQDQNNTTWGGIYCFDFRLDNGDTVHVSLGDYVQVAAHVHEYYGWTELDSITEFFTLGANQPLPDTQLITVSNLVALCDYNTEPYEDILVRLNNVFVFSDNGFGEFWIRDNSSTDSIRIDSELWQFGSDQPSPLPAPGMTFDWIVGVAKWQGRQGAGYERGWMILPRFASDYEQSIVPEPNIAEVWSISSTSLGATFDRVMDPVTTENPANYSTTHGLSITGASLNPDGRTVVLTTGSQTNNMVDSLVAINLCDALGICMTMPHYGLFHSGITPISAIQTPAADGDTSQFYQDVVTFKGVLVSDSTMAHPTNIWVNDTSGPPYNGVLVYIGGFTGAIPVFGDTVTITGFVDEYFRATEITDLGVYDNVVIHSSGVEPEPFHTTAADLNADKEGFEGVLVTLCDSFVIVNESFDAYGFLIAGLGTDDTLIVHRQLPQHTRYSYVPVLGTVIRGLTGVFKFQRDQFRISPRYDADLNSYDTWCQAGGNCQYVPGDINGNGSANGIDVTFGVGYFKGGNPPPIDCNPPCTGVPDPFFAAGDVNGNCNFNGIDITFFVSYLKGGQPALLYCPGCPPARLVGYAPDIPSAQPTLKAKPSSLNGSGN